MNLAVEDIVGIGESLIASDDFEALIELVAHLESSATSWTPEGLALAGAAVRRWKLVSETRRDYYRSQLLSQPSRSVGVRSYSRLAACTATVR